MNKLIVVLFLLSVMAACKTKKKEEKEKNSGAFFSVLSLLQTQVKNVDTGGYKFKKIEKTENRYDTVDLSNEEFRKYAQDFLMIPDISTPEKRKLYEESNGYDKTLNSVIYTYTTSDPDEEVRRETVMLEPDTQGNPQLSTIIVDWMRSAGDSTIVKNMAWYINNRFEIITKISKENSPEKIRRVLVKWE